MPTRVRIRTPLSISLVVIAVSACSSTVAGNVDVADAPLPGAVDATDAGADTGGADAAASDAGSDAMCASGDACATCGEALQPCCAGRMCGAHLICVSVGSCLPCGDWGQSCCPGHVCRVGTVLTCNTSLNGVGNCW